MKHPLSQDNIDQFKQICGSDYVITKKNQMETYRKDETKALEKKVSITFPDAVVKPKNVEEVSQILTVASQRGITIIPRGGGTGESGGAVPVSGGIVLSMERLDEVIEIDTDNLMAVVQAGTTLEKLYSAVEDNDLYFPPHPGDESAFIGGAVSTNAAGARCVRYGPIRNYVLGMEVVLPNGEILNLKGKLLKNNSGYALKHLFIGNEGTLGVITQVTLRLLPSSFEPSVLIVPFNEIEQAIETIPKVIRSGILPLGVEYVSKRAIELSEDYLDRTWPTEKGNCSLIFFISGEKEETVFSKSEQIMNIAMKHNALDVFIAEQPREKENVLEIRSKMGEAMKEHGVMETFDISVPPATVADLMKKAESLSTKYNVEIPVLGHAADGNVHHELFSTDMETFKKIKKELYRTAANLGGVITGEHGVGITKKDDLHYSRSIKEIKVMQNIKQALDPKNILNPGKVLPDPEDSPR